VKSVTEGGMTIQNNYIGDVYTPDPFSLIRRQKRSIASDKSFETAYDFDIMNRPSSITYPDARTVGSLYNSIGLLDSITGYIDDPIEYDGDGKVVGYEAANGLELSAGHDDNGRITNLDYTVAGAPRKAYSLEYDSADNVTKKNESTYAYDVLNQLITASEKGRIGIKKGEYDVDYGSIPKDYAGQSSLTFTAATAQISFDSDAMSIGAYLGGTRSVNVLRLNTGNAAHRIHAQSVSVYVGETSESYSKVDPKAWVFKSEGAFVSIHFILPVDAAFIKLHCAYDERNGEGLPVDIATVKGTSEGLLTVDFSVKSRIESYGYDEKGNRISLSVDFGTTGNKTYTYYAGSDRLKTDGSFAYVYDKNGNLLHKGSNWTEGSDGSITFSATAGDYWAYSYDLQNRMISASYGKAGSSSATLLVSFLYDPLGLKIKTISAKYGTTYTVHSTDGTILYEETAEARIDYIYAFGRLLAKETTAKAIGSVSVRRYYLTDNLGSTVMSLDTAGQIVWSAEYSVFGRGNSEAGREEELGRFTGKAIDPDTVLYYFNARWYDPELGRFTSEDPARDGLAWYVYCSNNPLAFTDPSGLAPNHEDRMITNKHAITNQSIIMVKAVVIHWTAKPNQPIDDTWKYFNTDTATKAVSAHYLIGDDGKIIHAVPNNQRARHVGGYENSDQAKKANYEGGDAIVTDLARSEFKTDSVNYPTQTDRFTLGIEVKPKNEEGEYTKEAYKSMVELSANLIRDEIIGDVDKQTAAEKILLGNVLLRHSDVATKECPKYFQNIKNWAKFKNDVFEAYIKIQQPTKVVTIGAQK
jgi:RHS repeat-associated protein